MSRKTLYILGVLVVVLSMVLAACAPQPAATPEAPTAVPFESKKAEAPGCEYGGLFKSIEAVDEFTVKFSMCAPDPAFLSKIAFTSFAIQPSEYLESTGGGGQGSALLEKPMGTGPYIVKEWKRGEELVLEANPNYWGANKAKMKTLVFRWSPEAAQRLLELQAGTVDGIDNPGPDDFATIQADGNLTLFPRPALNVMYIGVNNTFPPFDNEKVRQAVAMSIDRKRIIDNFYPTGSEVAAYFTPCAIPNGCVGETWYEFDPAKGKALLAEAGFPDGFTTELAYRDVVRGYLPQPGVVAQDIQAQLKENLNVTVNINVMESGTFLDAADSGTLEGFHMLGWGADYPDMTNFVDYHFGAGSSKQFGAKFDDVTTLLKQAAAISGDDDRKPLYEQVNNLIKQHIPMIPVAHGGSAVAFKKSATGAHASPLGNESFSVVAVPGKDTLVWMQNAEPISLYCADETDGESLRACEQVTESLYRYQIGGTATEPSLAESCTPNADLTEWVCVLRQGVKFHDGSSLDANDVVTSLLVQWDAANPLHTGNTGAFSYFSALWGGFLNAPK